MSASWIDQEYIAYCSPSCSVSASSRPMAYDTTCQATPAVAAFASSSSHSKPDVRVSAIEELREGEWREAGPLAEQDGQGVAGELAQPTGDEVPLGPGPDPLGVVAL